MNGAEISSRCVLACRDTLAAGLATQMSGMHPSDEQIVDLLAGIRATSIESLPAIVVAQAACSLDALHDQAMAQAWADGAWDILVSFHPPLDATGLGLVTAYKDYSLTGDLSERLCDAAERGRLATWAWRPMRNGPAVRVKAHAAKDTTLRPDGGRDGRPPDDSARPIWGWRKSRAWLIRLGQWSDAHRPKPRQRPATERQRACIIALELAAGRRPELPRRLSFDAAGRWIDGLLGA